MTQPRVFLAVCFLIACSLLAQSQDTTSLFSNPIMLGEIRVSSLKTDRLIKQVPASVSVTEYVEFEKQSALSLSTVLDMEPGINMGGDGIWATNINIRGMGEQRLVTLIDGFRVETANDLTASLSMIDVYDVERVEIIKGAQSSLYGTGAMGGIVNIITKDGNFAEAPYLSGNIISGFASANSMFSNNAAINAGSEKWYFRISGTHTDADDIRTPEGDLPNSRFTMNNASAKFGFKPFEKHLFKLQYQRNWSIDAGIPGGAAFPGPAEATYTDISRDLLNASYEIKALNEKLNNLKISYFTQFIDRNVSLIPNVVTESTLPNGNIQRTSPQEFSPSATHLTNGVQLQSTWDFTENNNLIAGVDVWGRRITSQRQKYIIMEVLNPAGDVLASNQIERGESPLPNASFSSAGFFFRDEARLLNDKLTLHAGGRIDAIWVRNEDCYDLDYLVINGIRNDAPPTQKVTFEAGNEQDLSWSVNTGFLLSLGSQMDLSLNLAKSFRSPSLEERFKFIDLGSYVRMGDPSLKPEEGYNADLGFRVWSPRFTFQSSVYVNQITNMIVESSGEFIYTLTSATEADTLPALINSNVSEALLYGFDLGFEYSFYRNFVFFGSGAYVVGRDTEADTFLPLIPPLSGRAGIRYMDPKLGSISFSVRGAASQEKIAEGESATDGYARLDLSISSRELNLAFFRLQCFMGIDNITDVSYTNHLSTNRGSITIEPGRNMYLRLKLLF